MNLRYQSWFEQAKKDMEWAKDSHDRGHYAQTCFICQQIGEKALKSYAYYLGNEMIKSHSIVAIAKATNINGEIQKAGQKLDLYYMSSRYPDAVPDMGIPSDYFNEDQSKEALDLAEIILTKIEQAIFKPKV